MISSWRPAASRTRRRPDAPSISRAPRGLVAILALSLVAPPALAQSTDQKVRCANAYEQAQRTRKEGLLKASREHLLVCAEETCPAVLKNECVKWLGEVDLAMPTVVVVAADGAGNEVFDVAVTVDGTKLLDRLDGKAVAVDPGVHTFKFVREGSDTLEQKILVREGEKRRPISVQFAAPSSAAPASPAKKKDESSVPTSTWVLGSFGVVAMGAGAGLWIVGRGMRGELDRKGCVAGNTNPDCTESEHSAWKRTVILGDVAFGLGVLGVGTAVVLWAVQPSSPSPSVGAAFVPLRGGGAFSATIAF